MNDAELALPRSLVLRILHAAQHAGPQGLSGRISAHAGQPAAVQIAQEGVLPPLPAAHTAWAHLLLRPGTPVPSASELATDLPTLWLSLGIKGVLEARAWQRSGNTAREIVLRLTELV